jgi:ribosomal protein S18 acetylase RimI-like enzyme
MDGLPPEVHPESGVGRNRDANIKGEPVKADIIVRNAEDLMGFAVNTIDQLISIFATLDRDIYKVSRTMTTIEVETGRTYAAILWDGTVGVIVGAMVLREALPWRRTLEIEKIAVAADHQRQGVGRCLIEHALAMGMRGEYEDLEVISHRSYKAEGFYEKCGFVQVYSDEKCRGFKHSLRKNA